MLSKEEIEKAKEMLNKLKDYKVLVSGGFVEILTEEEKDAIETISQYIKELEQSNEELDKENNRLEKIEFERDKANKIINEMAKEMYSNISMLQMAKIGQAIDYDPRKMFAGISDEEAIDCIKQYFEKRVEGKNNV